MAKLLKILGHIIGISFEWILIFILFILFAIHTSPFQTFITKKIAGYLSEELKTEISIDKVTISFINRLAIEGFMIKDQKNDTLAYISTLYVTVDEINPQHKIIVNKIEIEKSVFNLSRDKKTGDYNYWFITDYFASNESSDSKPVTVDLNAIHLIDVSLDYDDNRKDYSDFGMDYDHLKLDHINLDIHDMSIKDGIYKGFIKNLSAEEKCGFKLKKFSGDATVSPEGIFIEHLYIKTPLSKVYAPKMNLVMSGLQDMYSFEDSVSFDASLGYSDVSMKDVSYFATALEGMDQMVNIKADVSKKVQNLKIANLDLQTGKKTHIKGSLKLPDFNHFEQAIFDNEKLAYAYILLDDIKKIKLPVNSGSKYIELNEYVERLRYIETKNMILAGSHDNFGLSANKFKTSLGDFEFETGIQFSENDKNNSYYFYRSHDKENTYEVKVTNFQLGEFLADDNLGTVNGGFSFSGEAFSFTDIDFDTITADIKQFDYHKYPYKNIEIKNGSLKDDAFSAEIIKINDDNLVLDYSGKIDFSENQSMDLNINIKKALLNNLNLSTIPNTELTSSFNLKLKGNESSNISGKITVQDFTYTENTKKIDFPELTIDIDRSTVDDHIKIRSEIATIVVNGKVDFNTIIPDLEKQLSQLLPTIIPQKNEKPIKVQKGKKSVKPVNHFNFDVTFKKTDEVLALFLPELKIAPETNLSGSYEGLSNNITLNVKSKSVQYEDLIFSGVNLSHEATNTDLTANYAISKFYLNDSINVDNLSFALDGTKDILHSKIIWNPETTNESNIQWNTSVMGIDKYNISLLPSFFSLKHKKWNIINESDISINGKTIDIGNFQIEREKQYLALDGRISENSKDQLNFRVNDFRLDDFSSLMGTDINIKGQVNGWGYLSNPYTDLSYIGDANIQDLYIDDAEVGNVFVQSHWNKSSNSFYMTGDLIYKGTETFNFDGNYFLDRTTDNLDFKLIFDNTDIRFVNAFMDPDLITNIKGFLKGEIKVNGEIDNPKLDGSIDLLGGNAKLELLDVNFGLNGKISTDESGFYINNMPVTDEEGNTGSLVGSIYHSKFSDWNFDLNFNLEDDGRKNVFAPGYIQPLDKFLVMNTRYKPEDVYYGKGYATGMVNIFGYTDNIDINVDLKTEQGSKIYFPMYGLSDINEENESIHFMSKKDTSNQVKDPKINFTGVDMTLNFEVTPEAEIKIILNETTGDEIRATGSGDITVALNNLNDLTLDGTFKVNNGDYNFVMRPINEKFIIEENGTVTWTGDPYNALIDLQCYYPVSANLNEIAPSQNVGSTGKGNQMVKCYINLTESLMKPTISFDIEAPNATQSELDLLKSIKNSPDLLNKQFFSLLLSKKFQRIDGQSSNNGGAAYDLLTSQINQMLNQVSKNYNLNVDVDRDAITGGTSATIGIKKGILDDKLVFTGSIGVGNKGSSANQNSLIGDMNLEYVLNSAGTFKVNIFNESNQNSVLQNKLGLFTQGVGIQYQEDFNSSNDFKLYQYFLDFFRKKEKKEITVKRKKRLTPVPPVEGTPIVFIRKENYTAYFGSAQSAI